MFNESKAKTKPKRTTTIVAVSLPTELLQWVKRRSEDESRTVSNFVSLIIRKAMDFEGATSVKPRRKAKPNQLRKGGRI